MKRQFVNTLEEGDVVNDYYIATRKDLRDMQSGGKFLGMVFKDKTGEIGGVLWNNAASVANLFSLGDVVNVKGTVNSYQNRLQVRVDRVLPLKEDEYDITDLIYEPEDKEDRLKEYLAMLGTVEDPWLKKLLDSFTVDSAFMEKFADAAAGKKWHHSFCGGLARHCHEMTRIAQRVIEIFPELNRDLLLTGIFVHDIGKIEELSQGMHTDYTTIGKLVGHLELGCALVNRKIDAIDDFPEGLRTQLVHMILSHHGELIQGSPVLPKTLEAIALAHIDNLDAQVDAFRRVIAETRDKRQEWSDYIAMIDRQIFAKEP